eukprot:9409497-Alexandrium_andersonii.AAC.1
MLEHRPSCAPRPAGPGQRCMRAKARGNEPAKTLPRRRTPRGLAGWQSAQLARWKERVARWKERVA